MRLQIGIDGKQYEVDVEVQDDHDPRGLGAYIPPYAPTSKVTIPPPHVVSTPVAPTGAGADGNVCRSPMAGVVVKVNTQVGQQIQENDILMVLEAMKMETNITAPMSGKVSSIEVGPGDAVAVDQVVVRFE